MIEDLKDRDLESIEQAFLTWRRVSQNIPTPADILKILSGPKISSDPAYSTAWMGEEKHPGYHELCERAQAEVDRYLAQAKKLLGGGE